MNNIEQIEKDIRDIYCDNCDNEQNEETKGVCDLHGFCIKNIAIALDKAGYRKQSETVKEFIKDVKNIYAGRNDKEKHTMIAFLFQQLEKLAEQYGKENKNEKNKN